MATPVNTTGKVLYIDDDPLNLRLVRKNLVSMGYEVYEEMDAKQGLQAARNIQPDVILMDVHLPGMNGIEATKFIKESDDLKHIPVVAITADVSNAIQQDSEAAGTDAHLTKPISRSRLLKAVGQMMNRNSPVAM